MLPLSAAVALLNCPFRPGITTIPVPVPVQGIAWNHKGDRLYFTSEGRLHEWPTGRSYRLGGMESDNEYVSDQIRFREDDQEVLVNPSGGEDRFRIDLNPGKVEKLSGQDKAWWVGDQVATLTSDSLKVNGRVVPTDPTLFLIDGEGEIVMGAESPGKSNHPPEICFYRIKNGSLKPVLRSNQWQSEYPPETFTWNSKLGLAAVPNSKTGVRVLQNAWIISPRECYLTGVTDEPYDSVIGDVQWIGNRLLAVTRRDPPMMETESELDHRSSLVLVNPFGSEKKTLWTRNLTAEAFERVPRLQLSFTTYNAPTHRLAWVEKIGNGDASRIVVRELEKSVTD